MCQYITNNSIFLLINTVDAHAKRPWTTLSIWDTVHGLYLCESKVSLVDQENNHRRVNSLLWGEGRHPVLELL